MNCRQTQMTFNFFLTAFHKLRKLRWGKFLFFLHTLCCIIAKHSILSFDSDDYLKWLWLNSSFLTNIWQTAMKKMQLLTNPSAKAESLGTRVVENLIYFFHQSSLKVKTKEEPPLVILNAKFYQHPLWWNLSEQTIMNCALASLLQCCQYTTLLNFIHCLTGSLLWELS